jgi:hypothetical protein
MNIDQRRREPRAERTAHKDSGHFITNARAKRHNAFSHYTQVRESSCRSERCADEVSRKEQRA